MKRAFYFNFCDWTWWVWLVTAVFIALGVAGYTDAYVAAMAMTFGPLLSLLVREKSLRAFPVQLRVAYLFLLLVCSLPGMQWLYWLPLVGTFALVVFGYCLLARMLSLLPWNSEEGYSWSRLMRTFLSLPDPGRIKSTSPAYGCAGGLCTIEAQVPRE